MVLHVLIVLIATGDVDKLQSRVTALETLQSRVTALKARLEGEYSSANPSFSFAPPRGSSRFLSSTENNALDVIPTTVNLPEPGVLPTDEDMLAYLPGGFLRLLMSAEEVSSEIPPLTMNLIENGALLTEVDLNLSYYQAASDVFLSQSSQADFVAEVAEQTSPDWTALGDI
ncbi:hypothetical protein LguiB_009271 [Lonicera macranthoides]